jgi:hypothetical protein
MFESVKKALGFAAKGGGQLPPPAEPKVKPKQQSYPSYITSTRKNDAALPKVDPRITNVDIAQSYRFGRDTPTVIRDMVRAVPDLAGAVSAFLRVGIPERYFALARDPDGTVNDDATRLAWEILRRWAMLPPYDAGFSQTDSIRSISEALAKEGIMYGAMGGELVLDKARMPYKFQPINVNGLKFYPDYSGGLKGLKPVQVVGGEEIDLDIPTFFYVALDPSLLDPYPQSPIESAMQPAIASAQFLNDMRRVMARHVYPRYIVSIIWEKFRDQIPGEILADPEKLPAYLNDVQAKVENTINALGVEDALVLFDFIEVKFIEGEAGDTSEKFKTLKEILESKLATAARTMPAILGHGSDSQNVASTETMIFMLSANSMVRLKLQELFSKALTLAVRLGGHDVTVEFEFDPIELRPAGEMEAFRTMEFERIMKLWSIGLMSDMEASIRMTGAPPPKGFAEKSGTEFYPLVGNGAAQNPYSGTSVGGGQSGGGAANQSRTPQTPTKPKGNSK